MMGTMWPTFFALSAVQLAVLGVLCWAAVLFGLFNGETAFAALLLGTLGWLCGWFGRMLARESI
jgi:cell division protein FtsX